MSAAGAQNPISVRRLSLAMAVAQLISWGVFYYSLPIFIAPISAEVGWDRELLFWGLSGALLTAVAVSPWMGGRVDRGRGRAALIGGQLIGAASLFLIAGTGHFWLFLLLCCGIGICQGACLYDTAFSLLHRHLREDAPRAIIRVTLIAGLAGTVFVPAAQYFVDQLGWRPTAILLAATGLLPIPLYLWFLPRDTPASNSPKPSAPPPARLAWTPASIALVAAFGAATATFSTVTIHFVPLLINRGMTGLAAAKLFALVGLAQILARLAIWLIPARLTALGHGGAVFVLQTAAVSILAFAGTGPWLVAFVVLFGISNGLLTIVRGMAPAELCSRDTIGRVNGTIGAMSGLSRAFAPAVFALAVAQSGTGVAHALLIGISFAGALAFAVVQFGRRRIA